MKNMLFVLTCMLFLSGCKKDDVKPLKSGQSRFSFSVSGATSGNFNSDDLLSTVASSESLINVSASKVDLKTFSTELVLMILPADVSVKKYALGDMTSSEAVPTFAYTKGTTGWATAPGTSDFTIEVTKVSGGEVEGKVYGKLINETDETEISIDGTFSYKL